MDSIKNFLNFCASVLVLLWIAAVVLCIISLFTGPGQIYDITDVHLGLFARILIILSPVLVSLAALVAFTPEGRKIITTPALYAWIIVTELGRAIRSLFSGAGAADVKEASRPPAVQSIVEGAIVPDDPSITGLHLRSERGFVLLLPSIYERLTAQDVFNECVNHCRNRYLRRYGFELAELKNEDGTVSEFVAICGYFFNSTTVLPDRVIHACDIGVDDLDHPVRRAEYQRRLVRVKRFLYLEE